jgi:osmotically-inducible protein OsmY
MVLGLLAAGLYYWKLRGVTAEGIEQALRDTATTGRVKAALGLNRRLQPYSFGVSTEGGVVTLRGEVPREELKLAAVQVVEAVPEVRQVVNHVRVSPGLAASPAGRTMGESLDDRALELKLRLALSLRRELAGTDISVRCFRRQVTLSGQVQTPEQRRIALEVTRDTDVVEEVADDLRVAAPPAPPPTPAPAATPPAQARRAAERALARNPHLRRYGLKVQERAGRLVLRGRVRTGAERDLAGRVAREAAGGPVENALHVRP